MLKKFSYYGKGRGGKMQGAGLWRRCSLCIYRSLWQLFALAAFMQFCYLLWRPGAYLLVVLFLQVFGLIVWLQNSRL